MSKKIKRLSVLIAGLFTCALISTGIISRIQAASSTSVSYYGENTLTGRWNRFDFSVNKDDTLSLDGFGGGVLLGIPDTFYYVEGETSDEIYELPESAELVEMPLVAISKSAFANSVITKVEIPEGITSIGSNAFSSCPGLVQVSFPNSLYELGSNAFSGSVLLSEAILENTQIVEPGPNAFLGCKSLREVTLPEGLATISKGMFKGCTTLTSVDIPSTVTKIESSAFSGDTLIASFDIKEGVETIGDSAFYQCEALARIDIPSTVTSIGGSAFKDCSVLADVVIPDGTSITNIGSSAFYGCAFKTFTIPASCNKLYILNPSTFANNTQLTRVNILTDSIATFDNGVFNGCSSLEYVDMYSNLTGIGTSCFNGCSKLNGARPGRSRLWLRKPSRSIRLSTK